MKKLPMIAVIITPVLMTLSLQKSPKWWNLRNQTTLLLLINLRGNKIRQLEPFPFSTTQQINGAQRHHRGATAALLSGNDSSWCEAGPGSRRTTFPPQEAQVSRTVTADWSLTVGEGGGSWKVAWGRRVEGPKVLPPCWWPALFWASWPLRWLMGLIRRPIDPGPSPWWFETSGFRASNEAICCMFYCSKKTGMVPQGGTGPIPMTCCCSLILLKPSTLTFMLGSAIIQ